MPTMTFDVHGDSRRQNNFVFECPEVFQDVEMAVFSVSGLFSYSVDTTELNVGNRPEKTAGKPSLGQVTLVILDTVTKDVVAEAYEWFNKVYNIEGNYVGVPSEYKKAGNLLQCDLRGEVVRTWALTGVWPSSVSFNSDFSYESEGDFVQFSLTLEVDKIVMTGGGAK